MSTCSSDDEQSEPWVGEVKSDEMKKKKKDNNTYTGDGDDLDLVTLE